MDAVKYFEIRKRMTKSCSIGCNKCDFGWYNNGIHLNCNDFENEYPEKAVEIAEQWENEHPLKTRAQVFFERFPDAPKHSDGRPIACAKRCGLTDKCRAKEHKGTLVYCIYCWQKPAPDKYQEWGK